MSTKSIVVDYDLPHPPEKVWRALTDSSLIQRWLMPNDFKAAVGHEFTFKAPPIGDWDGVVRCKVTACDPPTRLSYSWVGGGKNMLLDSTVTWTLTATATGTHLHLDHAGFTDKNAFAFDAMSSGWQSKVVPAMGGVLESL